MEIDVHLGSSDVAEDNTKPKQATSDVDATQISKRLKAGNAEEGKPSITPCQSMTISVETSNNDTLFGFTTPAKGGTRTDRFKRSTVGDQLSAKSKSPSRKNDKIALDSPLIKFSRRKTSAKKKSPAKRSHSSSTGKAGNARRFTTEEFVEEERVTEDVMSVKETRGSQAENSHLLPEKASSNSITDQDLQVKDPEKIIIEINELKDGESQQRKIRGRPRKLPVQRPKGSVEGALNEMVVKDFAAKSTTLVKMGISRRIGSFDKQPVLVPSKECLKLIADNKNFLSGARMCTDKFSNIKKMALASKNNQIADSVPLKRVKQLGMNLFGGLQQMSPSVNTGSPVQDSQEASKGKSFEVVEVDSRIKDVAIVVDEMPSEIFDEQPLLTWLEGMDSGDPHGSALNYCNEASKKQNEMATPSPAVVNSNCAVKCHTLPFVKCSPLWNSIESLEVFQKMPQRPHFSPVAKCKEDSREGLAIGHMVTFANAVERMSMLQFANPKSIIDRSLETLVELENHGFDVEVVRVRLNELLSMKDRAGHLEDESKQVGSEIMKHNLEKTELEKEINQVEMTIRVLQEKLESAASMKEAKEKEVAILQSKVNSIFDSIRSVKLDFDRLAASPL